jgi:rhamnosyltransferase
MEIGNSISVILPTRNNSDNIEQLLIDLFSQKPSFDIEVIILDSSDDITPQIVKKMSLDHEIKLFRVEPEDYNYGGTRNLGISYSRGDFLVLISTDIEIINENWLKQLHDNFIDERVAGVYGRQIPKKNTIPMEEFFIKTTYPEHRIEYDLIKKKFVEDFFFSNTNTMIRRKVWEKIHIPEMLKSEDQEWGKRALIAGYKLIYDPKPAVYHSHNYSLSQVFKEYYDSGATLPFVNKSEFLKSKSFIRRGIIYELSQIKYFIENGYTKHIPYSLVYDFMKFFGYFLGTQHNLTPLWLKRKFTKKANHWDKYDNIIRIWEDP